jgi:hypothetical protein
MNFLKRRTSEETTAQNQKIKQAPPVKKGTQNIMYQDYLTQKSRSPQNAAQTGTGAKIDYYMMMGTS